MATCDMGYEHDESVVTEPEPAPVIVEPSTSDNDVKVAEIQADAQVETEKIWADQRDADLAAENERLRGELSGVKETLALLQPPEPETPPEPVPVPVPVPAPESEPVPAPSDSPVPAPGKKKSSGWWDNYA